MKLGIDEDEAVKLSTLRVSYRSDRRRRLTITAYSEWTLGVAREHTQHQVVTSYDPDSGAIFARNSFDPNFAGWQAFAAISEPVIRYTGDRREFIGRNGTLGAP